MSEIKKSGNPFSRIRKMQAMAAEEMKKTEKVEEPQEAKEEAKPVKKVNPFAAKKAAEKAKTKVEKKEDEAPKAVAPENIPVVDGDEDGVSVNPDNDDALIAVADTPENEEPVAEKPKRKRTVKKKTVKEEPKEEASAEKPEKAPTSESEPEAETEVKEEKPKSKKKEKSNEQVAAERILTTNLKSLFTSDLSVEEAARMILKSYSSPEYEHFKEDIFARISEITIDPDMNPGTIRYKLHEIDALKMELLPLKVQTREFINGLMQKDYGAITAYISENSVGSNDTERKRNGFRALASYDCDGHNINLLTTMTGVQMRDEFLDAILGDLENKQKVLITYLGTLKVDSNVAPISY